MGLVEDDSQIFSTFEEACVVMLPFQLRKFCSWYLLSENIQESDKNKLREVDVIIWDKASMIPKNVLEIIDKTLKDVCNNDLHFGAPHNDDIRLLNDRILNLIDGEAKAYYSIDATHRGVDGTDDNIYLNYPPETLNQIKEGLPSHQLNLKIHAIVMLIRNLSINEILCNGTRLRIKKLYEFNIEAEIITGEHKGNKVFIPRITLNTGESSSLPFILYRKQFPIVLAFAMTINKSQGQSFNSVGLSASLIPNIRLWAQETSQRKLHKYSVAEKTCDRDTP
ncbi:uncharacterized protein LOC107981727 [Nasonia vitripennis]|uniref:DNA helicase Pif1-like 2B domain-containing protein n=1 Tax=Nasonia vitripennis TaxID=7425 RepID=A0A7M7IUQ9_NASVI|nr:uncharacterized protein LOC107981727 [Nasonia vitripennis]